MGTASFCGGVRHKRYSGQPDPEGHAQNILIKNNLAKSQSSFFSHRLKD